MNPWMMNKTVFGVLAGAAGLLGAAGCSKPSRAELRSFADPYFPDLTNIAWQEAYFRLDADGDFHLDARCTSTDPDGVVLTRLLDIHVFWRSQPGKTPDHPTSTNSLIRYAEIVPGGGRSYSGAGFVYIDKIDRKKPREKARRASLEGCELAPKVATGQPPADRGQIRITGEFYPRWDDSAAVAILRDLEIESERVSRR